MALQVSEIIYNASKGSKFFNREEARDKALTKKIDQILRRKLSLEAQDLSRDLRNADRAIVELDASRDLSQTIVHVDCDAFYAAVEQLERPELKTLPFAVGSGVLTTCNYVAREYGCRSGMAGFVAKKLCPELVFVKPNFRKYAAKANQVREVFTEYDPRFESASIDEAYLNITEYCADNDIGPEEAVEEMRSKIHLRTQITVSAGIAANTKIAKICSNMNKPNGQFFLPNERIAIARFMRDLPTRKVNGVGRVLERELLEIGVKTCGDIYEQRKYLNQLFGEKTFGFLLTCYLGLGRTRVQPAEEFKRKSIGAERTFSEMSETVELRHKLRSIAEELEQDLKRAECKGRTLCLKVKLHTYEVLTRQQVLPRAIDLADDLYNFALPMLSRLQNDIPDMKLRLLGLRSTHLVRKKPDDAMAFFGFKQPRAATDELRSDAGKGKAAEALEEEAEALLDEETRLEADGTTEPQPARLMADREEEWWDCPICKRPQSTDERHFNAHIDLCLSRQTIRDAVQEDGSPPRTKAPKTAERRRGRASASDPKQKKLFFGEPR